MSNKELRSESSHYNNLSNLRDLRDLRDPKSSVSIRVNPWSYIEASEKICVNLCNL